jgi:hypothetical protein
VGSFAELFSKWLDHQMKKLLPTFSKTYLKDSFAVLDDIQALGPLPPNAKLFTADAVSMYTNIDTAHAMETFGLWFATFPNEIPTDFPKDLFLSVLEIVMKNNIFQFDDMFWLQLHGTAMGTSTGCMYATLYYAYHERLTLLSTFSTKLLYFRRFVDDIIGIWWDARNETSWLSFQASLPFGSLRWETTKLSNHAVFLDLKLTIDPITRRITTKTYQKPMNLFLYIPPHSAHPSGVLKSIIYGNLRRYWIQNSNRRDYISTATSFAQHLVNRGHNRETIKTLFMEAAAHIDSQAKAKQHGSPTTHTTSQAEPSTLYIHWEYHPHGLQRQQLRQMYNHILSSHSGFKRMIVAFSRPRNLRDLLMPTTMKEPPEHPVSSNFPPPPPP